MKNAFYLNEMQVRSFCRVVGNRMKMSFTAAIFELITNL